MRSQRHALGSDITGERHHPGDRSREGVGELTVSGEAGAPEQVRANAYRGGQLRADGSWGGRSTRSARSGWSWAGGPAPSRLRSFSPARVGHLEAAVWIAYYRRQWARFLALSVLVVRTAFGMDWIRTVHGAWLVLRANQLW